MLHISLLLVHSFIPYIEPMRIDSSGSVVGNLRRRDTIPLHQIGRRYYEDDEDHLLYRRTKEIREDRRFEMTENLLHEASKLAENKEALDKYHSELRWLTIDTDEGLGIRI